LRIEDDLSEGKRLMAGSISGPPGEAWHSDYRFKHKPGSKFGSMTA